MKTKLLKKIRKRFDYYWNSKRTLVIIDYIAQKVVIINKDFLKDERFFTEENFKAIEDYQSEYLRRVGINYMTSKFGVSWDASKIMYKKAIRVITQLKKQNKKISK